MLIEMFGETNTNPNKPNRDDGSLGMTNSIMLCRKPFKIYNGDHLLFNLIK